MAATNGAHGNDTGYTILCTDSISGTFAEATTDLAFLTPQLSDEATSAKVIMARNSAGFGCAGSSPDQQGVGVPSRRPGGDRFMTAGCG